jgi:hypothetical protein
MERSFRELAMEWLTTITFGKKELPDCAQRGGPSTVEEHSIKLLGSTGNRCHLGTLLSMKPSIDWSSLHYCHLYDVS